LFASLALLLAVFTASSCGRTPASRYYVLQLGEGHRPLASIPSTANGLPDNPRVGLEVGVRSFQVDPPYDQDRIVYRIGRDAVQVGFYPYDRWAVPLSRMLTEVAAEVLGQARGIAVMEPAVSGRSYSAFLEGRVLALEEIDTPGGDLARLSLELSLLDASGYVLWQDSFDRETAIQAESVDEVVREMRSLLDETLTEARTGLQAAIGR
jgi:uncharacterized lipoprotein YmbA